MNSKVLIIGLILLLSGIIASYASISYSVPSYVISPLKEIELPPNETRFLPISLNATGDFLFSYNSSIPLIVVFSNSSAYPILSNTSNFLGEAVALKGTSVFYIANASKSSFPYINATNLSYSKPIYQSSALFFEPGTYFISMYNYNKIPANVTYRFVSVSGFAKVISVQGYLLFSSILFLLGLILVVASFFMKGKATSKEEVEDAEIQKLYDDLEKKKKENKKVNKKLIKNKR